MTTELRREQRRFRAIADALDELIVVLDSLPSTCDTVSVDEYLLDGSGMAHEDVFECLYDELQSELATVVARAPLYDTLFVLSKRFSTLRASHDVDPPIDAQILQRLLASMPIAGTIRKLFKESLVEKDEGRGVDSAMLKERFFPLLWKHVDTLSIKQRAH